MELTKEELAAQYEKLSTNELLRRFESGTLVPLAHEVAREELLARGVALEEKRDDSESGESGASSFSDDDREHDFVTIARIVNPLRANLLKVHLESEGIVTHVLGGHLGVVDIYLSAGSGGVHVQVRKDQAERALEILNRFDEIEREIYRSKDQDYASPTPVSESDEKRKQLNKPASPFFFWFFAIFAVAAAVVVVTSSKS